MRFRLAILRGLAALVSSAAPLAAQPLDVLLFTRTEGFRHGSIADGVAMFGQLATENGWTVDHTEETAAFEPATLALYDVVVWLSTTGDVLDPPEEAAFEGYVEAGGGWVGIHAAADCEYGWPWYGQLLGGGAWFHSHPAIQTATLRLEDPGHPAAGTFENETPFEEEWYNFQVNPRPAVDVVMTVDEASYDPGPGGMGADHPIAWAHHLDAGRAFYTALGHMPATFADARFREQVRRAVLWAAGFPIFADGFEAGGLGAWSGSAAAPPAGRDRR